MRTKGDIVPVNIIVGLISLLVALILYSIATIGALRAGRFTTRLVVMLWIGVGFDVLATLMMAIQIGGLDLRPGTPLVHTVLALVAMAGMLVGAAVGSWTLSAGREDVARLTSRLLLAPWLLWVAVFVWGMATRGAARMGG
jgi:hypothetical protein